MSGDLSNNLKGATQEAYGESFVSHRLEQYKLFVEMMDKVSERKQGTNSFFLAINTAVLSLLGVSWSQSNLLLNDMWTIIIGGSGILLCTTWESMIQSAKTLNSAKFKVIHEIENQLPLKPYYAEWKVLKDGKDKKTHIPFNKLETKIPWIFIVLYIAIVVTPLIKLVTTN